MMNKQLLPYLIGTVVFVPCSNAVDLIGKTTSEAPLNVVAEVSGVIEQVIWQTGDIVTQGQKLATIKDQDFKLEVRKKKASFALVKADLDVKKSVYSRYQELRSKRSLSQNELDIAKADFSAAKANLALAQIELEKAQLDLSNTHMDVAINGYVVERYVDDGSWVNKGDLLYKLTNIDQLIVRLLASEFDLQELSVGQPIQIWSEALPAKRIRAKINRISVELDPATFAYFVDVDISNKQHLFKPGMSIHATTEFESATFEHTEFESKVGKHSTTEQLGLNYE